jgi:hypothetical protein
VGQAVVKLQGWIAKPFQISIPEFKIKKGRVTDAQIREHMKDIAPACEENGEMTRTGRLKAIALTDKGETSLPKAE